jgi:hypothetical protein
MAGDLRTAAEGNGFISRPFVGFVREEKNIEAPFFDGSSHVQEKCCAELRLNGRVVPFPLDGCWCGMLNIQPPDEVIFSLGKSILDGLRNNPLRGQDGSLLVVVELHI